MKTDENNNSLSPSSLLCWFVSAVVSAFIGTKLTDDGFNIETIPAILISLSIFLILGWALRNIFCSNVLKNEITEIATISDNKVAKQKVAAKSAPAAKTKAATKKPAEAKKAAVKSKTVAKSAPAAKTKTAAKKPAEAKKAAVKSKTVAKSAPAAKTKTAAKKPAVAKKNKK